MVKLEMFNLIIMFHEKVSVGTQSYTLRTLTLFADRVTEGESVCPGLSWTRCSDHMSRGQQQSTDHVPRKANKHMHSWATHTHTSEAHGPQELPEAQTLATLRAGMWYHC